MSIFYISDLHLGHKNCISFDNRPYTDVDEMAEDIVARWNAKVGDDDHVYLLGDVCYKSPDSVHKVLERLNGHIHLVIGNHDPSRILKHERAMKCFESVDWIINIRDGDKQVCLCHFPIISWEQKHRGSYHVYGHVHTKINEDTLYMLKQERAFNCGCMLNNYEPCTLEELEANKRKRMMLLGIGDEVNE